MCRGLGFQGDRHNRGWIFYELSDQKQSMVVAKSLLKDARDLVIATSRPSDSVYDSFIVKSKTQQLCSWLACDVSNWDQGGMVSCNP